MVSIAFKLWFRVFVHVKARVRIKKKSTVSIAFKLWFRVFVHEKARVRSKKNPWLLLHLNYGIPCSCMKKQE